MTRFIEFRLGQVGAMLYGLYQIGLYWFQTVSVYICGERNFIMRANTIYTCYIFI